MPLTDPPLCPQHRVAPPEQLRSEGIESGSIRRRPGPDDQVALGLVRLNVLPPDLPQPAADTIAGHRGRLKPGDDQSHPWVARRVVDPEYVEVLQAPPPSLGHAPADVRRPRQPARPGEPCRCRQEPPCFEGSEMASRFRPFFRRRDSTARPQRVAIRARNPCLLIRRLFRGRYDGFMRGLLPSEPGKLAGEAAEGQGKAGTTG
jgi:hypothetical protein